MLNDLEVHNMPAHSEKIAFLSGSEFLALVYLFFENALKLS